MLKQIKTILKNKNGLSEIVGYVLLITFAVIMGAIVYAWMNSYLFTEKNECPEDVSLIIKSYTYDCFTPVSEKLNIEFQNKGLFNISAFKIRGSTDANKERATIEILPSDNSNTGYHIFQKPLSPNGEPQTKTINFDKTEHGNTDLTFVEITPYVFEDGKANICTNAMIKQKVECSACIDSDGGTSYFEKGTANDGTNTGTDICIDTTKLTEYFCNADSIASEEKDCTILGTSYTCDLGRCVT